MSDIMSAIKSLAESTNSTYAIEPSVDKSYIDAVLRGNGVELYFNLLLIEDRYYAVGLEGRGLPREMYPDDYKNGFTPIQRSNEIIKNAKSILSKELLFHSKPTFLHKDAGYIAMTIDGSTTKFYQKSNVMKLKLAK